MDDIHSVHIVHKPSSPTLSSYAACKILPYPEQPKDSSEHTPLLGLSQVDPTSEINGDGRANMTERTGERHNHDSMKRLSTDELTAYDLRPPPLTVSESNAERLTDRLFSVDHLNVILKDSTHIQHFTNFLNRYRSNSVPTLVRYLESHKALTAIRFANALAEQMALQSPSTSRTNAATVHTKFEAMSRRAVDELVNDALPSYITFRMVHVVTECLVKEITGNNTPLMRDLVVGLAEVYCVTDPSLPDNPIIFASEEFHRTTQYGRDYAIGKNCRFLQGPKTQMQAVKRISRTIRDGLETSEILLNYRRDGTPFLNLAMMAPLMDHRGKVRYYVGCQVDITQLVDGGKGLESFQQLITKETETQPPSETNSVEIKPALKILHEFSTLLNDEEVDVLRNLDGRRDSVDSNPSTPTRAMAHGRRFVGMDEPIDPDICSPGPYSGRLPGVYQNYLLVRPYPSLRIIFTSAALRIPGLSQSKLMDHIGGSQHVRQGLIDALAQGIGVTAKVSWLTQSPRPASPSQHPHDDSCSIAETTVLEGKPRWIHCTPLMGSDARVGVIMVVIVDKEEITGSLNGMSPYHSQSRPSLRLGDYTKEGWPLRNMSTRGPNKLYADYLRREGKAANANGAVEMKDGKTATGTGEVNTAKRVESFCAKVETLESSAYSNSNSNSNASAPVPVPGSNGHTVPGQYPATEQSIST